jgi:hypothetical protein
MGYPFFTCEDCRSTFDENGKAIHITRAFDHCESAHPNDDPAVSMETNTWNMTLLIQNGNVRGFLS